MCWCFIGFFNAILHGCLFVYIIGFVFLLLAFRVMFFDFVHYYFRSFKDYLGILSRTFKTNPRFWL